MLNTSNSLFSFSFKPILVGFLALVGMAWTGIATAPSAHAQVLVSIDEAQWERFPTLTFNLVSRFEPDSRGLVGSNKGDTGNYNAFDQFGAGSFSRFASLAKDDSAIERGLKAISLTLAGKKGEGDEVGGLTHVKRIDDKRVARIGKIESLHLDAKILADFCIGLLVVDSQGLVTNQYASLNAPRIEGILNNILEKSATLLIAFQERPDKLMPIAAALQSCGSLVRSDEAREAVPAFVRRAITGRVRNGAFGFGGFEDVGLGATAARFGLDLLAVGYTGEYASDLRSTIQGSIEAIYEAVDVNGELDTRGSLATCKDTSAINKDQFGWSVQDVFFSLIQGAFYYSDGRYLGTSEALSAALGSDTKSGTYCF